MADIQAYLDAIENAVYGEDVRGSIHDAIEIINDVGEKVITAGTAVTSPSSSVEGFFEDSLYFNTNTDDLWQCNGTGWTLLGNLKGSQGNPGNPGQAATIAVGTVTKGDNASVVNSGTSSAAVFDFVLPKGDPGPAGVNTWGSITGDIDDQTDLKNALGDVYAQSEELVDRTVGWVCNNLFDIEAVEMGKDIYGEAAANAALFTLNCKPSTRYYLSVHGTNNLQVSYNTTALGPTEVLIASFPYDFLTTQYDTYIKICFTKSGLTKSDIEALQFMLTEVANAPYSEYHSPVSDVITDVYGVMGEMGAVSLANPDTFVNGILNAATGAMDSTVNWITSDYIDISGIKTVRAQGWKDGTEELLWVRCCFYNSNKTFISCWLNPDASGDSYFNKTQDVPANTKYARISLGFNNKTTTPTAFFETNRIMFSDAKISDLTYRDFAMTNEELTDAVTPETDIVTLGNNITASENKFITVGKIAYLYLNISSMPDASLGDVTIGTVPKSPASTYAFADIMDSSVPFGLLGKAFIRQSSGEVVIRVNSAMAGKTSCFVQCVFATQ